MGGCAQAAGALDTRLRELESLLQAEALSEASGHGVGHVGPGCWQQGAFLSRQAASEAVWEGHCWGNPEPSGAWGPERRASCWEGGACACCPGAGRTCPGSGGTVPAPPGRGLDSVHSPLGVGAARDWNRTPASVLALPSPAWGPAGDSRVWNLHASPGRRRRVQLAGFRRGHVGRAGWAGRGASRPMGRWDPTGFSLSKSVPSRLDRFPQSRDGEWTPAP